VIIEFVLDLIVKLRKEELPPGTPLTAENLWMIVVKSSGQAEDNPLPIGTPIRGPHFLKLAAIRLTGDAALDSEDAGMGLQVMQATISTRADLVKLASKHLDGKGCA
jgi:hypothetical protein